MAGLTLLKSKADWANHQFHWAGENQVPLGNIDWGRGPDKYPCLVATVAVQVGKCVTCYLYEEQATALLQAVRETAAPATTRPDDVDNPKIMAVLRRLVRCEVRDALGLALREITANLRAIVEELVEVKITNPDRYEKLLAKHLADVDQYLAELAQKGPPRDAPDLLTRRIMPKDDCEGI